jgi:hypothetical protein
MLLDIIRIQNIVEPSIFDSSLAMNTNGFDYTHTFIPHNYLKTLIVNYTFIPHALISHTYLISTLSLILTHFHPAPLSKITTASSPLFMLYIRSPTMIHHFLLLTFT